MKKYKFLAAAAVVGLTAFSAYTLITNARAEYENYQAALQAARDYAKDDVIEEAIAKYQEALAIKDTVDLNIEIGQAYLNYGWDAEAAAWGEDVVQKFGKEPEAFSFLAKCYYESEDYDKCFELREEAVKKNVMNEDFKAIMEEIEYFYTIGFESYEDVSVFGGNLCAVFKDGKWGYAGKKGALKIHYMFSQAMPFNVEGNAAVQDLNGEWYYISETGNKAIPVRNMKKCLSLGIIINNVLAACDNGVYGYYDAEFNKLSPEGASWQYATAVNNGVGAAMEKDKWTIVNSAGSALCKDQFDDVVRDEKEIAFRNDRLFAKAGDSYKMIDSSGNQIGKETYEDAKVFMQADSYAAVKINGKWGFADRDGNLVIEAQYDDARSFSNGYAAVKQGDSWGYILPNGQMVIPAQFALAMDFNSSECAFIFTGAEWRELQLLRSNY